MVLEKMFKPQSPAYDQVAQEQGDDVPVPTHQRTPQPRQRQWSTITLIVAVLLAAVCGFLTSSILNLRPLKSSALPRQIDYDYSPLEEGKNEWQLVRFNQGMYGERNAFMADGVPNKETERAWNDITGNGMVKLTKAQSQRLGVPSVPFPNDPTFDVAGIGMWHQLHCLNLLRRAIYPEAFALNDDRTSLSHPNDHHNLTHTEHCVEYLRQSIVCYGDTHVVPFARTPSGKGLQPDMRNPRFCRNYDLLEEKVQKIKAGKHVPGTVQSLDDFPDAPEEWYQGLKGPQGRIGDVVEQINGY